MVISKLLTIHHPNLLVLQSLLLSQKSQRFLYLKSLQRMFFLNL